MTISVEENRRKLSKEVENAVGKGEIACYEQFLLFPQCFQKACFPGASKGVIVWEWVKIFHHNVQLFFKPEQKPPLFKYQFLYPDCSFAKNFINITKINHFHDFLKTIGLCAVACYKK